MPVAATLFEARNFAQQNCWGRWLAPVVVRDRMESWITDLEVVLDQNDPEQAEALGWLIPSIAAIQALPTTAPAQDNSQLIPLNLAINALSRTIERLEDVSSLTGAQVTAILSSYNTNWAS